MTYIRRSLLAACAVTFMVSQALAAEPYGNWVRPSNGAQVTFYDCGGKLCGKVARGRAAPRSALSLSAARSNPGPTNGRATCSTPTTGRRIPA